MDKSTPPNALALFREEQRALRSLLADARPPAGAKDIPLLDNDPLMQSVLPELRRRLLRYCRLEEDFLQAPLITVEPPQAVADARVRCDIIREMLELLEVLHGRTSKQNEYRSAFTALADHALLHFDATQATLFPLAHERRLDLAALGEQMRQVPQEPADDVPAADRVADGRLDIGTADGHTPTPTH